MAIRAPDGANKESVSFSFKWQKALDRTTKATKKKILSVFLKENARHKEREKM